jgi:N-acetylglucosaminyl-diphospho-decaprenol L-rhamnosyltransferase
MSQQTEAHSVGDVAVVVTHYRNARDLVTCLRSLAANGGQRVREVLVCDSEALPEHEPVVLEAHPGARYLGFERNVGFSALVNAGVEATTAPYVLVLNADIVVAPGTIDLLAAHLDRADEVGVVLPRLVGADGEFQHSVFRFYKPMTVAYRRTPLARLPRGRRELGRFLDRATLDVAVATGQPVDIDWGLGASWLVRRTAWARTGPMDVEYFLYFEDVDWFLRCWQAGWRVQYLPTACCRHAHGRASASGGLLGLFTNPLARVHVRSALRFFRKHGMRPTRPAEGTRRPGTIWLTGDAADRNVGPAGNPDRNGGPTGAAAGRAPAQGAGAGATRRGKAATSSSGGR